MASGHGVKLSDKERRLVVVGRSGSGKSSVVNTLLGEDLCDVNFDAESTTVWAKIYNRKRFDKDVRVVDTPGLFDSRPSMGNDVVLARLAATALLLAPGPHAILLTLALGQKFSEEEKAVVKQLRNFFGQDSIKHTIVVFTKGDQLEVHGRKIDDYLAKAPTELKSLITDVGHRYVVTNNVSKIKGQRDKCAQNILDVVEKMVQLSPTKIYSSTLFEHAEMEMQVYDRQVESEFRPGRRVSSTSSVGSLSTLDNATLNTEITNILRSDRNIAKETDIGQDQKQAGKDRAALAGVLGRLVRMVSRKRLGEGKNEGVISSLVRSPAMLALLPLLPAEERGGEGEESISNT